jgi:ribosomal protein S18 acetylase RimI-like enzyme
LNETEGTVLAEMDRGEEAALCFEGHQAVACVRFYSDNGLYFHRLAVRPACQGRGIGKAMIAWLEREAIARGERSLACRVRASSPRNVALYKALGFVVEREVLAPNPDGNLVRTVHMRKSLAAS